MHLSTNEKPRMSEITLKIVGVHYAANDESRHDREETPEMHQRTIDLLRWLDTERPLVVLMPDRTNPVNPNAVMARALGRLIGYVADNQLEEILYLFDNYRQGRSLVRATIDEVTVKEHGRLTVKLEVDEKDMGQITPVGGDWREFLAVGDDLPQLAPDDDYKAQCEAKAMIEDAFMMLDEKTVRLYMDVWIEHSRHDLSYEAKCQRQNYIWDIEEMEEYMDLSKQKTALRKQQTAVCGQHLMSKRIAVWWKKQLEAPELGMLWNGWRLLWDGNLRENLQWIDNTLRLMPDGLYAHINTLDVLFSKLYYLDTPRDALNAVLTLLKLRHRICNELGISNDPLPDSCYAPILSATDTDAEERQLHERWRREEEEYNRTYDERIRQADEERKRLAEEAAIPATDNSPTLNSPCSNHNQNVDSVDSGQTLQPPAQLPPQLQTTAARIALKRLQQAGLIDEACQPMQGVSNAEKGTIVAILAEKLKLDGQWVMFAKLWGMKPTTLRQAYNIGKTQKKTQKFSKNIKDSLR